jgi:phosphohistidine phosphatase SixA
MSYDTALIAALATPLADMVESFLCSSELRSHQTAHIMQFTLAYSTDYKSVRSFEVHSVSWIWDSHTMKSTVFQDIV